MNRFIAIIIAAVVLVAGGYYLLEKQEDRREAVAAATDKMPPEGAELLFVQEVGRATFKAEEHPLGASEITGTLTLEEIDPATVWFTDRPVREAGHMPTTAFWQRWDEGPNNFRQVPPNASLVWDKEVDPQNAVIELSGLQSTTDTSATFSVRVLMGTLAPEMKGVSVFVDPAGIWPSN